jgi:hypothetical protein
VRGASGPLSAPEASWWAYAASGPKRARTSVAGRAAKSPRVRTPRRRNRSTRSGRSRVDTSRPARNAGVASVGDDLPGPGGQQGGEDPVRDAGLRLHPAGERDLLDQPLGGPRLVAVVARRPRAGSATAPGRTTSTPGATSSTATTTGSYARASRSGSWASTVNCGHRPCASRLRSPRRTPSARAASEQATTRLAARIARGVHVHPSTMPAAITGQSGVHSRRVRTPPLRRVLVARARTPRPRPPRSRPSRPRARRLGREGEPGPPGQRGRAAAGGRHVQLPTRNRPRPRPRPRQSTTGHREGQVHALPPPVRHEHAAPLTGAGGQPARHRRADRPGWRRRRCPPRRAGPRPRRPSPDRAGARGRTGTARRPPRGRGGARSGRPTTAHQALGRGGRAQIQQQRGGAGAPVAVASGRRGVPPPRRATPRPSSRDAGPRRAAAGPARIDGRNLATSSTGALAARTRPLARVSRTRVIDGRDRVTTQRDKAAHDRCPLAVKRDPRGRRVRRRARRARLVGPERATPSRPRRMPAVRTRSSASGH